MILVRALKRLIIQLKLYLPIRFKSIQPNLIVSLTSYSKRLPSIHLVIRSILHQSLQPEKIILYLDSNTKESDIPNKLKKLTKYNFEIKTGYQNLKPHTKYFYAMKENPNSEIITIDDDLIYDNKLIEDLYSNYQKYPNCIIARRVHLMTKSGDKINSYNNWKWEYTGELQPSHSLIATGVGGVLYPHSILPDETFDIENIQKYCLNTDDIWLKFMEIKNDVKIVFTNSKVIHPLTIRKSQDSGLLNTNTAGENRNDININLMQDFTGINLANYTESF